MKRYSILLLFLLGLVVPTFSHPSYLCNPDKKKKVQKPKSCPEESKPKNPNKIIFDNQGKVISKMPTVILKDAVINIEIEDNSLNNDTPYQKKIKNLDASIWDNDELLKIFPSAPDYRSKVTNDKSNLGANIDPSINYNDLTQIKTDSAHDLGKLKTSEVGEIPFQLTKSLVDNQFFKKQFDNNKYNGWSKYKEVFNKSKKEFEKYAAKITETRTRKELLERTNSCEKCPNFDEKIKPQIEELKENLCLTLDSIQVVEKQLCSLIETVIEDNKEWMKSWLWFTGGRPLLNPFVQIPPSDLNMQIERELAASEELLRLYRSLSEKCCESSSVSDMLEKLKNPIAQLSKDMIELRRQKDAAPARQKNYEDWLKSTAQTEMVLNKIKLYISDCYHVDWMNNYNASYEYIKMNSGELVPDYIFENDALQGLVHNIPTSAKVSAKEFVKPEELRTELDIKTDEANGVFTTALASSSSILALLERVRSIGNSIASAIQPSRGPASGPPTGRANSPQELAIKKEFLIEYNKFEKDKASFVSKELADANYNSKTLGLMMIGEVPREGVKLSTEQSKAIEKYDKERGSRLQNFLTINESFKPLFASADKNRDFLTIVENIEEEVNKPESQRQSVIANCNDVCLNKQLESFDKTQKLVKWLSAQTEPPISDLNNAYVAFDKTKNQQAPKFRTENVLVNESREAKGSNQIKYEVFESGKEKPMLKDGYKTYNNVRFWPLISINYVLGSRAVSIFDNTTGQFQTNTDIDNFEAVVGVKYYLKESNMTRTRKRSKFISQTLGSSYNQSRGNGFCSKIYAMGGLGISHKFLKNYFLGFGIDITPGFSIHTGGNLFFRKAYNLNNSQIDHEFDIPSVRGFVGIAIDPNVVTKLIRIF